MILLIDNYDSFSYNLYQLVGSIDPNIRVERNDALAIEDIRQLKPSHIILSPGPGRPEDAGVCLGHQAICEALGGEVSYAKQLMHGKQSVSAIDRDCRIFRGLPEKIPVARYHSLSAVEEKLPDCLKITAKTEDGEIMAVRHKEYAVYGLQFHPESIMTPDGMTILKNFLEVR